MAIDAFACALDLLAAFPTSARALVAALPAELRSQRPTPDEWSVEEVLAHLLHAETMGIRPRIEQMLAEEDPLPAAPPPAPRRDTEAMLEEWAAARAANLIFLRGLTSAQLARTGRHPRFGIISVREHIIEWAYHDQDHLQQVVTIMQAALYSEIGAFQALYPRPR